MQKIPVSNLLALFQQMEAEHWPYVAGAAERGQVDCSGAFVWAYKQCGKSIYHGSNRIARYEVEELIPVGQAEIVPGMAAFKARKPGESGYALPADYKQGGGHANGDLNDYYHIGLVGKDGKTVLNAQSAAKGFVSSPIGQNWAYVARLKQVEYDAADEEETPSEDAPPLSVPERLNTAIVYASNGKPVRMRNKPSDDPDKTSWVWVPVGTRVTVRALGMDGWAPIRYNGKDGYMMEKFLLYDESAQDTAEARDWIATCLTEAQARAIAQQYENAVIRQTQG